jgi:hypothetical protein
MKVRAFMPALIALIVLLGSPFSSVPLCASKPHGGLVCYCCADMAGKPCPMISCKGCKGRGALDVPPWTPELIVALVEPILYLTPVFFETASFCPPETVYIEVPIKPPIAV